MLKMLIRGLIAIRVAVSWSGGKESCLACYKAILDGYEVSYLLNFISYNGRCMFHGLDSTLMVAQSRAIGLPIIQWRTSWSTYERNFKSALRKLRGMGLKGVVFGDIREIPGHEGWVDRICDELDMEPIKPLWGYDPMHVLLDFINEGFKATVVMVKDGLLTEEWLGRRVDKIFMRNLMRFKGKIDPCGELGEYHTYVTDGPIFKRRIRILECERMLKNGCWYLNIKRYEFDNKGKMTER